MCECLLASDCIKMQIKIKVFFFFFLKTLRLRAIENFDLFIWEKKKSEDAICCGLN